MFDYALFMASDLTPINELAAIRRRRAELDARETYLLAAIAADPLPCMEGSLPSEMHDELLQVKSPRHGAP